MIKLTLNTAKAKELGAPIKYRNRLEKNPLCVHTGNAQKSILRITQHPTVVQRTGRINLMRS
jgi:hypothetical protein